MTLEEQDFLDTVRNTDGGEFHKSELEVARRLADAGLITVSGMRGPRGDFFRAEPTKPTIPVECERAVKALLTSSWRDINNEYDKLTSQEKGCLSQEEHAKLLEWIQS